MGRTWGSELGSEWKPEPSFSELRQPHARGFRGKGRGSNSNKGTTIETEKRVPIGVAFLGVFTHVKMKDTQKVGS